MPSTLASPNRDALIAQYAPLVKYVVGRLAIGVPAVVDHEDILSYGTIGLIEAIDRFDDSRGVKFETYAITRIRGAIIDALRALDQLPRSVRQKARLMHTAIDTLQVELARPPTHSEVAGAAGMTREVYNRARVDSSWVTVSLDGLLERNEASDGTGGEVTLPDHSEPAALDAMIREETLAEMTDAVSRLPERELLIVSLYYHEGVTMREIAQILDISESRVCQLHARALGRLRNRLAPYAAA
ncbi:MAG: FliA/WhiG family RNA polymerase sigma factor [Dehalococcoidia bacterium]